MSYLERERAKGDADGGADVLALAPEDGEIGHGEDVVLLAALATDRRVVHNEPILNVCNDFRQILVLNYSRN